jgi:hypothetical protein
MECLTGVCYYCFVFAGQLSNNVWNSPAISRTLANSSVDCVSKYSQLVDGAW